MASSPPLLYETLDSLAFPSSPGEDYAVIRNHIVSSADDTAAVGEIPVADYFSLDTSADADEVSQKTPLSSRPSLGDRTPKKRSASESAWFQAGRRFKSPMIQLHKEILDFCDFVSPTPEEQVLRAAAVQCVSDIIKHIWPHCKVEVFGSFRTGLYLPTSDIDVVILDSNIRTPQMGLRALAREIKQRNIAKKIQVIANARVPIIKFVEKRSEISFDISFDIAGGPKAADFIKGAVKNLPPLRPLCLILKVFLQQRELNEVYSGGIGSYTLLSMLIAHLQSHWKTQDAQHSRQSIEHNLGILLVNFFDLYGRKLNTSDVGVSCNSAGTFYNKIEKRFFNSERPDLLSIQDPQAPENDIGRNSYNFYKLQELLRFLEVAVCGVFASHDPKAIVALGPDKSILGTIIRPDPVLLDRRGGDKGDLTFNSLLPGAGEYQPQLDNGHGNVYNWQVTDDEPLPREILAEHDSTRALKAKHVMTISDDSDSPPRKRRKIASGDSSTKESSAKKRRRRRNRDFDEASGASGSKESSAKKRRRRRNRDFGDGYGRSLPSNVHRSY